MKLYFTERFRQNYGSAPPHIHKAFDNGRNGMVRPIGEIHDSVQRVKRGQVKGTRGSSPARHWNQANRAEVGVWRQRLPPNCWRQKTQDTSSPHTAAIRSFS